MDRDFFFTLLINNWKESIDIKWIIEHLSAFSSINIDYRNIIIECIEGQND